MSDSTAPSLGQRKFSWRKLMRLPSSSTIGDDSSCSPIMNTQDSTLSQSTKVTTKNKIIVTILVIINLLNYMDRFTIAGLLKNVQDFYDLSFSQVGLLQTAFIISYMLLSPVFGYMGDRYNRKYIIIVGVALWSFITLASSFIPKNLFGVFLFMRSLVGVGEASYSTVAPTMLSDMFAKDMRIKVLGLFFFATPVGSGLGYIVGYIVNKLFDDWQVALRVTPILGLACVLLTIFFVDDPPRGNADKQTHLVQTTWLEDVRILLCKSPSYLLTSLGFTTVAFTTGALTWWAVLFMNNAINYHYNDPDAALVHDVSLIFGVITCAAGILGVFVGVLMARHLRGITPRADAYVCAIGMLCSTPFLMASLVVCRYSYYTSLVLVFFAELFLCLNWALVTDISMSVVSPNRRATASALQMLLSHALGDAGSPYLVGLVSEIIKDRSDETLLIADFNSLQYALFITPFICVLGGAFFLWCSFYLVHDKTAVEMESHKTLTGVEHPVEESSTGDFSNYSANVLS